MKIKERHLLVGMTASFLLFTGGFFLGRNLTRPAVVTQQIAPVIQTVLSTDATVPEPAFPLNLNTASAEELDFLPGIGQVLALRIVEYRETNGPYRDVSDLLHVNGIGPSKLEDILPYIEIGG